MMKVKIICIVFVYAPPRLLTLNFSTPSPTCSITPEHSKPNINGALGRDSIAPCLAIKSWKFKPLEKNKKLNLLLLFF